MFIQVKKLKKKIENLYSYICKFYLRTIKKAIFKTFSMNTGSYEVVVMSPYSMYLYGRNVSV